jgi:hypothetical protein
MLIDLKIALKQKCGAMMAALEFPFAIIVPLRII